MGLVSVNSPRPLPQGRSTLEKVATGVQLAEGILGTALAIPKFAQEMSRLSTENDKTQFDIMKSGKVVPPDQVNPDGTIKPKSGDLPGTTRAAIRLNNGLWIEPQPDMTDQERNRRLAPAPEPLKHTFLTTMPEFERTKWTPEMLNTLNTGIMEDMIKANAGRDQTAELDTRREVNRIKINTIPTSQALPPGMEKYHQKVNFEETYPGSGLGERWVPLPFLDKLDAQTEAARQRSEVKSAAQTARDEADDKDTAKYISDFGQKVGMGGRGAGIYVALGQQGLALQKVRALLDDIMTNPTKDRIIATTAAIREIGLDYERVMRGGVGQGTEAGARAQEEHDIWASGQKIFSFINSTPMDQMNEKYLQNLYKMVTNTEKVNDWQIKKATGIALDQVKEMLNRPIYNDRHPDWKAARMDQIKRLYSAIEERGYEDFLKLTDKEKAGVDTFLSGVGKK